MPQSNDLWIYDSTKHRWIPTILGCAEIGDLTQVYGSETLANRTLDSVSRTAYNWAYRRSHRNNKDVLEQLFAFDCHEIIKAAILAHIEADIVSGVDNVKHQHGVNTETGLMMKGLSEHMLSLEAQDILMNSSFASGNVRVPLIVQYDWGIVLPTTRYEDWEY